MLTLFDFKGDVVEGRSPTSNDADVLQFDHVAEITL
jgi:hypothetical protein